MSALAATHNGLTELEAERRLEQRGTIEPRATRSTRSIVLANTLTPFNAILTGLGVITLVFGDWRDALFLFIILTNSGIGIWQELRAKSKLDELAALVAPRATVVRDGQDRQVAVQDVLADDLVRVQPGDQVVADGDLVKADGLLVDESILTGESEPVARVVGETVRSGAFVVEGSAVYVACAVGEESYAERIAGAAREFRHPRSPLETSLNRLLYVLVAFMAPVGAMFMVALAKQDVGFRDAVTEAVAGLVTLVPEGLILLVSLTFAVAAMRMARRGALSQQLNAIESLASVDTICIDKTGTLTEARLDVRALVAADGVQPEALRHALGRYAASTPGRNLTLDAIHVAYPAEPEPVGAIVPFSSRYRWSGVELHGVRYVLGGPEAFDLGPLAAQARAEQEQGRRVVAFGTTSASYPDEVGGPPPPTQLLGLVILAEELRPGIQATVEFLLDQGVDIRVLSGDDPHTVAAIARDAGIPLADRPLSEAELPADDDELRGLLATTGVVGRISPEGKKRVVEALTAEGRYVAMVGDGINDVPALKQSRLAIAQGSGAQMAKAVADVVLVGGDFSSIPPMIAEGRKVLRNLQRVAKLYVTKSVLAAFLILSIGLSSESYPLLPRHLTLAAALAIGIPTFFLALAPSSGSWSTDRFLREVGSFAVPAGVATGLGVIASFLITTNVFSHDLRDARTVATTVLIVTGLYFIVVLEAAGVRRSSWVAGLVAALFAAYVVVLSVPKMRSFFDLAVPGPVEQFAILVGLGLSIGFLVLTDERFVPAVRRDR
jgi:cation-transporting P-type ATPase E